MLRVPTLLMFTFMVASGCQPAASDPAGGPPLGDVLVTVAPSAPVIQVGTQQQFTASVANASTTAVTWSVQEGPSGGVVSSAGLYTAPEVAGLYHVVATSVADPSKSATAVVTVTTATQQVVVAVSPSNSSVQAGGTQQFTATVSGASNDAVSWSVREGAAGGMVSASGLYTAPMVAGTYHVVATSQADVTRSATAVAIVTAAPLPVVVTVNPGTASLSPGGSQQFSATVTNDSNTMVTWSVQEGSPDGGTITATGLYTAPATSGSYHVVATSTADTTRSATAAVSVGLPPATTYTRLAAMPAHDGAPGMQWLTGEVAVIKDVVGGDLVSFFKGSTGLHAAVSRDLGGNLVMGRSGGLGEHPEAVHHPPGPQRQGPRRLPHGRCGRRLLRTDRPGARRKRSRDGIQRRGCQRRASRADERRAGHPLPDRPGQGPGRKRHDLLLRLRRPREWIARAHPGRQDQARSGPGTGHELRLRQTRRHRGGDPRVPWRYQREQPGFVPQQRGRDGPASALARPLVPVGPIDTGDTLTQNRNPIRRLRATPSGPTAWTLGSTVSVESFDVSAAGLGSAVSTPTSVWLMRFSPASGILIDRVDAQGNVASSALPSPDPTAHSGGYVVLSVNAAEDRAWVGGWISYDAAGGPAFWARHWNGSTWQKFTDTAPGDVWGVGQSVGWDGGLTMVVLDMATFAPSFATIRTLP